MSQAEPQTELFTLTDKAAEMVKKIMESENKQGIGLRVTVAPGGCSGYTYGLDFSEKNAEQDLVIEQNGVEIYIDEDIEPLVRGAKLDYVESLMGAGFVLDNPNASSSCGCGKSFQ